MSEEEVIASQEETPDTSTETDDAEAIAAAPEASKEEPTEESDAESDPALDSEKAEKAEAEQKKIAEESYKRRESKRVRDLRIQNERLMAIVEQSTKANQPEPTAPKIDDFETLDDYIDARVKYLGREEAPEPTNGNEAAFNQKRDDLMFEGAGKYEDFVEKVSSESVVMTPIMADAIFELDDMDTQVELTYALADNPREAMRIARLSPLRQAAEIGKLEAKLSNPKSVKKQPSKAPAPIKPVGGSKTTSSEMSTQDSYTTFLQKRNKQLGRG